MRDNKKGIFLVVEGVDGSGKSTQAARLADWLENRTGRETIRTAEPYILRKLILRRKDLNSLSEVLLFLADRAEHVAKIIVPNLEAGNNIVCERYNDSTLAYQVGGHGVNLKQVENLISACDFPAPDATVFFDISPEIAFERVGARNNKLDKFEAEGLELIKKVSECYREHQKLFNWIRIFCDGLNEDEVFEKMISALLWEDLF